MNVVRGPRQRGRRASWGRGLSPTSGSLRWQRSGRSSLGLADRFAIADKVVGILVAGDGVVLGIHPVVVAMVAGLRELGDVELLLRIEMPFPDVTSLVARSLKKLGIGDFTRAKMSRVVSREVSPNAIPIRSATC